MPAHADTLSLLPRGNARAQFIDDTRDFMSWNARILNAGPLAFFCEHVAVADAAGLYLDAHLPRARLRNLALDDLEIGSRFRNLRHFHWRDCDFCSCHVCLLLCLDQGAKDG